MTPPSRATMIFDTDMRVADDYRGEFVRMIAGRRRGRKRKFPRTGRIGIVGVLRNGRLL
jgi:hypothetical protein